MSNYRYVIFCSCFTLFYFYSVLGESKDQCVKLWLKQKPDLKDRFSVKQIQWLCERTNEWVQKALSPSEIPADDVTTPKQRAW